MLVGAYKSMREDGDSVRRRIIERRKHPKYNPEALTNNIMVLKLDRRVDGRPSVWLNTIEEIPEGADFVVLGFGSTAAQIQISKVGGIFRFTVLDTSELLRYGNDDGPMTQLRGAVLHKGTTSIVSYAECDADDQYAGFIDNATMICAGSLEDGDDICKFYRT